MEPKEHPDSELLEHVRSWDRVPPLRLDLRFVRSKDAPMLRLCDPKTQKCVELYELECLVAQAMDGERSSDDLTTFARAYNPAITRKQIDLLVLELLRLGLLEEPLKPGHGKVIPLPLAKPHSTNEFSAFRNEVVLDLQRNEALTWVDGTTSSPRRPPFFEPEGPPHLGEGDHGDDLDGATLSARADPFEVLEQTREQLIAAGTEDELRSETENLQEAAGAAAAAMPARSDAAEDPPAQVAATPKSVSSEQEELWKQSQSTKVRWYQRRSLRVLLVVAALIGVAAFVHHPLYITSECSIVPTERVYVRSAMRGVIAEILVDEGATVHKGDVIARLDERDLTADQRKASAEVEKIEAELLRLHHGARPQEISQQRAVLQARQTAAAFAKTELTRRTNMANEGVGPRQAQNEAALDLQIKQGAVSEAAAALKLLEAGTRPEEIAALEAALKRAQAELEFIEHKLSDMVVIRAPIDGVVLTPRFRERLRESIEAGGLVCEIASMSTVRAEIFIPEREADTIALGMPIVVKVESYPLHPFDGTIDFIAPTVEVRSGVNVVRVTAKLDNHEGRLRQNMTGYGEVNCGSRSVLDLATRRLVRWVRVRFLI